MSIQITDLASIELQELTTTEAGKVFGGRGEYEYEHGYKKEAKKYEYEYEHGYKKEAKEYEYEYGYKKEGYFGNKGHGKAA